LKKHYRLHECMAPILHTSSTLHLGRMMDIYTDVKDYIRVADYSSHNLAVPLIVPDALSSAEVNDLILHCYKSYYMKRAPDYFMLKDTFKRNYLKRSLKLIMQNSLLPFLISSTDKENQYAMMYQTHATDKEL